MRAVVVGGGIGGLSAAIGLRRAGWDVEVLERAPAFGEVGAGLTLWPNALRALESLGLGERLAAVATPQRSGGMRRTDGTWLSRWDGAAIEERLGRPMLGVHRAALHRMLLDELPPDVLRANVTGRWDEIDADLIVGADGIDSGVRRALFPDHPAPAYAGLTAWRGVCAPDREVDVAITWGRGAEVGVVPLVDGRIYWYVSVRAPEGVRYADEKAHVQNLVRDWHDPIPDLIAGTPADAVLHHDLRHLGVPLRSYVSGRTALLGDAAHAMTPHLGQGGCQAIEDAAVLAAVASSDVPAMLAAYDRLRRPRSQQVAKMSARIGRFTSDLRNPALAWLRDTALRLTPQSVSLKGMTGVADWNPPG